MAMTLTLSASQRQTYFRLFRVDRSMILVENETMNASKTFGENANENPERGFRQLRKEKREQLREIYDQLDIDKDGKVDIKELAAALRKRLPNVTETPSYAQEIMKRADVNSDDGISFNEFVTYALEHEKKLALTFREMDVNKDGVVDYLEVKRYFIELGITGVTDRQAKEIVARMAVDGRDTFSLEEFQGQFLLYPSSSSEDIAKYWQRTLFIDIGDSAALVPEVEDKGAWWQHLQSGAVAGAMSRTSTAPLERLKIFLQVYASRRNKFGVWSSLVYLLKEGGLKSLWRGNGVTVIKIMPESAMKFWSYEQVKVLIGSQKSTGELSWFDRLVAGSVAGGASQTAVYPLEVLKTRMALRKTGEMNHGVFLALRTIYNKEGFRAFGRGYLPNLMGIVPYAGTEMAVYETLKNVCVNQYLLRDPGIIVLLACGIASSTIAQLVSYPLALVRTRLQAHPPDQPSTMRGQFSYIVRQEGLLGLYRGLIPNFMKVLPSVSISYVVYELVRKRLGVA